MVAERTPWAAQNQRGLFTRDQAREDGWTSRQIKRRLAAGRWWTVAGAALAAADLEIGAWQLAHAVVLTWPGAVPSHELAGSLWGFPVEHHGIGTATVGVHRGVRAHRLKAVRRELPPQDRGRLGGLPITTEWRTAIDLLAGQTWDDARNLWAWLSTRNRLSLADLRRAIEQRPAMTGTPQLRRLLEASAGGSLSAAEDVLHELLRSAGIFGWTANTRVTVGRTVVVVDVLFERERVVVEVDGFASHGGRAAFQRDRANQNALVAAGYVVLRFTWADLTERPAYVVRTIRTALSRATR